MERGLKYNGVMAQISGEEDGAAVSGLLSRDSVTSWNIFCFVGLNILISTFFVCAEGFQALSKVFHYPIQ
jgi:hypothetical protein